MNRHIEAAASQMGVDYGEALGRIVGMPQTPAERQEARRKRLLIGEGRTEVRGIYLPPALHAALKAEAEKLLVKHRPGATDAPRYRCIKCGYRGPLQVGHDRPSGSGECGYIASEDKK